MLIARAPLRISLAGGGTDLPSYYEEYGGMVVSTTIDKYVYAHLTPNGAEPAQITSADYQTFYLHHLGAPMEWEGDLALPRAVLHELGVDRGVTLFVASEVPPGTGLGSSSAVAVALVRAVSTFVGRVLSRRETAELACKVELEKLGAPIGKQDQYAAAYGGLNALSFSQRGVRVEPIGLEPTVLVALERRLLLFFTGVARNSATILREQTRSSTERSRPVISKLHLLRAAAFECRRRLLCGDLDGVGDLLHESWLLKRGLASGIATDRIDEAYEVARRAGALGGKITGAGGGGFLLLYCRGSHQARLTEAMESLGLHRMEFHFAYHGASVQGVDWDAHASKENGTGGASTYPADSPHLTSDR